MGDLFGLIDQRLDHKYAVESLVAEGGFGVVYRARHCSLKNTVALKVLKVPDGVDEATRQEWMKLFAREAQTLARLDHPAIVRVLDFGMSTMPSGVRAPWMALEWIEGRTLADELEASRRVRTPAEALARLRPVISALASAHAAGVSHRDVKPSNMMCVEAPGEGAPLRLFDFGIAKVTDAREGDTPGPSGQTATRSALQAYSLPYAAPEQLSGTRSGPWTDVHAIGLVLTEILIGRPAYPGLDTMALCVDVLAAARPTPARAGFDVGAWEPVLQRALALRPGDRHADAGALLAALEAEVPAKVRVIAERSRRGRLTLAAVVGIATAGALVVARARWSETPARAAPSPVTTVTPDAGAPRAIALQADAGTPEERDVTLVDVSSAPRERNLANAHPRRANLAPSQPDATPPAPVAVPTVAPTASPPPPDTPARPRLAPAE